MPYVFMPHTADVKFRASSATVEGVFKVSALALKQVITKGTKIESRKQKRVCVKGFDLESLLYNFLEELLYLLDAKDFIVSRIDKIKISNYKLDAEISGDKASDYKFANDVKAVTYSDMFVKRENKKWIAQVVLDV